MAEPERPAILVEVMPDPTYAGRLAPVDLVERFQDRVQELGAAIGDIAERLHDSIERRLADDPARAWSLSEVTLQLGANLEAESGVIICKTKVAGSFQVQLKWTRPG